MINLLISFIFLSGFMLDPFTPESADIFTEKMSHYFDIETKYQMYSFSNSWWSATVAYGNPPTCTDTVYLSTRWYNTTTPLWKYALVHEWVHVSEGYNCGSDERITEINTLKILAEAKEWGAFIAGANHFIRVGRITMNDVVSVFNDS